MSGIAGTRILVVEDDFLQAVELSDALVAAGAHVVGPVGSCAAARFEIASRPVHFALLDILLNDGDVFPCAHALLQARTPFVFLSGVSERDLPPALAHIPFMPKPVPVERLVNEIGSIVANAASSDRAGDR